LNDVRSFGWRADCGDAFAPNKAGCRGDRGGVRGGLHRLHGGGKPMIRCPVCGSPHDTVDGAVIHMRNMKDDAHGHIVSLEDAFAAVREKKGHDEVTKSEVTKSEVKSEVTSEVTRGDPEKRKTGQTPSDIFDEPSTGAELSDYTGDDESDYLVLYCGHQRVHKSNIPPDALSVECEVCGVKQEILR